MSEHDEIMQRSVSVGRIVHYADAEGGAHKCWAAIVTAVGPNGLSVAVFPPGRETFTKGVVAYSEDGEPRTWHWPEHA